MWCVGWYVGGTCRLWIGVVCVCFAMCVRMCVGACAVLMTPPLSPPPLPFPPLPSPSPPLSSPPLASPPLPSPPLLIQTGRDMTMLAPDPQPLSSLREFRSEMNLARMTNFDPGE